MQTTRTTRSMTRKATMLLTAALCLLTIALDAAPTKDKHGYYVTGYATRVKKIVFANFKVYAISHHMKEFPATKSRQAVIDADVDKKIVMKMLRSVEGEKLSSAVVDAFRLNGYTDMGKVNTFLSVVKGEAKEGSYIIIWYDAAKKTTYISYGGRRSSVAGIDFMKGLWSCWFGKIDQPSVPNGLMSRIP